MACLVQESKAIVRFLAEELGPDTYINLMAQYIPSGLVGKATAREPYEEINRHVHREEYGELVEFAASLGLRRLDARSGGRNPARSARGGSAGGAVDRRGAAHEPPPRDA